MKIKVCKFGGTSMADKKAIERVRDIILSDKSRRFVVVSAPGKRFSDDIKVTDLLYACFDEKQQTGKCESNFSKIRRRFEEIVKDLELNFEITSYLDEIEEGINKSSTPDYAASRGEYLSALIMSRILNFEFVDAKELIKFNGKGEFDSEYTNDLITKNLGLKGTVIPGFYGAMPDDTIKTFTRGGSDFTGAIVARGVSADVYENWTDVDGFMVTDPRVVKNPKIIKGLSYDELRELSYMGASVLHPQSTFPLQNTNIPINIKNTFAPDSYGTFIVKEVEADEERPVITGIAGRKNFTSIFIKKAMMNNDIGFCRKVLSVLEYYGISLEHMPTGIDTMSLIIEDSELKDGIEFKLIESIRGKVNPDLIYIHKEMSLIAVVGQGMSHAIGISAKIFAALSEANINIQMIDQGSSEINIIIGVDNADMNRAIAAIYKKCFE